MTVLKNYLEQQALNYDEYVGFRRLFAYNYGAIMAVNYVMAVEAKLDNYVIDMKTGNVLISDFRLKQDPRKLSPYSVRLSRNIMNFLTKVHVSSGVLPAMVATSTAFSAYDVKMKDYLDCIYEDLPDAVK